MDIKLDIEFDSVDAEEFDRMQRLHQPLTYAIRDLIEAAIHTGVDEDTLRDAQSVVEAVTRMLRRELSDGARTLRDADSGRPLAWANPVVGVRNPVAPPLDIHHEADGRCWSEFDLGPAYEGPPGLVHGGICALVLDHILGEAASDRLTRALFTGTITLKYLRGTPLGPLRAEAYVERTEGVKTFARGVLRDADGVTVEAEGVFIVPSWARDPG